MEYYQRIRDIREDRDLKQDTVAKVIGTERSYYGKYERGQRPMLARQIIDLCNYYNLSADYVLGLTDEPRNLRD